jgi:hypothetical protein
MLSACFKCNSESVISPNTQRNRKGRATLYVFFPLIGLVLKDLFTPDGQICLYPLDDLAAGFYSFFTVWRRGKDKQADPTGRYLSEAMIYMHTCQPIFSKNGLSRVLHHFERDRLMSRIFYCHDLFIPDPVSAHLSQKYAVAADCCLAAVFFDAVSNKAGCHRTLYKNIRWFFVHHSAISDHSFPFPEKLKNGPSARHARQ